MKDLIILNTFTNFPLFLKNKFPEKWSRYIAQDMREYPYIECKFIIPSSKLEVLTTFFQKTKI